ncbi:MAG TPA: patatin-like phospholipase family protein [Syntrophorhabdales bacterium]|nr:patatin-like phospholipase family protein [Syntrophorhabdales bacterium]
MTKKADAVFEGGGVKGIGLVGAVSEIEKAGYEFQNLAGTSAGAIVAGLLAVGYSAAEIEQEMEKLDYNKFKDEGPLDEIGLIGKGINIGLDYGIYEGKYFESWYEGLLVKKGKKTFGQIKTDDPDEKYRYKFQAIASDISDRKLLVLPRDLAYFGLDPDQFSISRAVRMSMSIPIFFEPVKLRDKDGVDHYIVDGGALSNYPIWLLDDGTSAPPWPTFGFKLMEPDKRELKAGSPNPINSMVTFLKALGGTMMDAHDNYHISNSKGDFDRTIGIPTVINLRGSDIEIKTTDFGITREQSQALFENGATTARTFLAHWDFDAWVAKYRK